MNFTRALIVAALLNASTACNRSDPPAEQLKRAAEDIVAKETGAAVPQQSTGPYAPRNECAAAPGASEFLADLRRAVEKRDAAALVANAAEDVKLDFGGGAGVAEFRKRLEAEDGSLWRSLDELMTLGCASDGNATLTLPWVFAQDTITIEGTEAMIVTGQNMPLLKAAGEGAPEIARISWDVVRFLPDMNGPQDFARVEWTDAESQKIEGFIARKNLRSLIDYRLEAAKRNDRWRIVSFVAGD